MYNNSNLLKVFGQQSGQQAFVSLLNYTALDNPTHPHCPPSKD